MIEKDHFTEQAWEALRLAAESAQELGHNYVGTEHLLIGLLQEETGVAARVLESCGVKTEKVIELIRQLIYPNQSTATVGQTSYTPSAVRVLNPGIWREN